MTVARYLVFVWIQNKKVGLKILKLFLDAGLDINAVDDCGISVLHHASAFDCSNLVRFLLENTRIDVQLRILKYNRDFKAGETALDVAQRKNFYEIASILKEQNVKNYWKLHLLYIFGRCRDFIL